jgi:uncharacterized protein
MEKCIDPQRLARNGEVLEGSLDVVQLKRLSEVAGDAGRPVDYCLRFSKNEANHPVVEGEIQAEVILTCQRCGEPMTCHLQAMPKLQVCLNDEQAARVATGYEPMVTEGKPVTLASIVEEELLLALPMVAKHEFGQCPADLPDYLH